MKKLVKDLISALGYEVHKTLKADNVAEDLDISVYQAYPADSIQNRRFYNIGAGTFSHPCWTNIDFESEWYGNNTAGISYDLFSLKPLPIASESAEVVYTSHSVEHINNEAAQNMFDESYRILKPGGYFRVTTPNIDLEYRAYKENDRRYYYWIDTYSIRKNWERAKYNKPLNEASIEQIFLTHFASSASTLHSDGAPVRIDDAELRQLFGQMDLEKALDYCCSKCPVEIQNKYPGNHMNWWNFNKARAMLEKAGFTKIYLSAYGQSYCPALRDVRFFDNTHPPISLYVEAIK